MRLCGQPLTIFIRKSAKYSCGLTSLRRWRELLVDLKARGSLSVAPRIAAGDGALGFWRELEELFHVMLIVWAYRCTQYHR